MLFDWPQEFPIVLPKTLPSFFEAFDIEAANVFAADFPALAPSRHTHTEDYDSPITYLSNHTANHSANQPT